MSSELAKYYDRLYGKKQKVFGNPISLIAQALPYLSPEKGLVLDIGAGQGRHTIGLAEKGFSVEAVDESEKGIAMIRALAEKRHLPITARVADITAERITGSYQAIICTFVLHELSVSQGCRLLIDIHGHTAAGGVNIIAAWVADPQFQSESASLRCFFQPNELPILRYDEWERIVYEEKMARLTIGSKQWQAEQMCAYLIARKIF